MVTFMLLGYFTKAQDFSTVKYFVGFAMTPSMTGENFNTFDVSDYIRYPNAEGRVTVPLGEKELSGSGFGFNLGAMMPLGKLDAILDMQFRLNGILGVNVMVGGTYNIVAKEKMSFGPTAKVGFSYNQLNFGETTVYGTPPVIAAGGSFYSGDKVATSLSGLAYQLGVSAKYNMSDKISVLAQLGFGGAKLGDMKVEVTPTSGEAFTIDLESSDCVDLDHYTHIAFTPKAKSAGVYFNLGVAFGL